MLKHLGGANLGQNGPRCSQKSEQEKLEDSTAKKKVRWQKKQPEFNCWQLTSVKIEKLPWSGIPSYRKKLFTIFYAKMGHWTFLPISISAHVNFNP